MLPSSFGKEARRLKRPAAITGGGRPVMCDISCSGMKSMTFFLPGSPISTLFRSTSTCSVTQHQYQPQSA
eukprot:842434-Rhodomonas_salina.1